MRKRACSMPSCTKARSALLTARGAAMARESAASALCGADARQIDRFHPWRAAQSAAARCWAAASGGYARRSAVSDAPLERATLSYDGACAHPGARPSGVRRLAWPAAAVCVSAALGAAAGRASLPFPFCSPPGRGGRDARHAARRQARLAARQRAQPRQRRRQRQRGGRRCGARSLRVAPHRSKQRRAPARRALGRRAAAQQQPAAAQQRRAAARRR